MWIKICGICDVGTATEVARQQPNAIGLNFYPHSPRCVTAETAEEIVRHIPADIEPVGLFVNNSIDDVISISRQCHLRTVQIHGDEPPELLAELQHREPQLKIIRAFRIGSDGLSSLADYLRDCDEKNVDLFACLIDARIAGMYGGSGETAPWEILRNEYHYDQWPPMILAGGLNPDNVSEAIRETKPWGVDVASGVETQPGVKSPELVTSFIKRAKAAFSEINQQE